MGKCRKTLTAQLYEYRALGEERASSGRDSKDSLVVE
jgi:hypothetical protein